MEKEAFKAMELFIQGQYEDCIKILTQLLSDSHNSERESLILTHNLTIAHFFRDHESKPQRTLEEIRVLHWASRQTNNETLGFFLSFNLALLYFRQKQFSESEETIQELCDRLEMMDPLLASHICLFACELALSRQNFDLARFHLSALNRLIPGLSSGKLPEGAKYSRFQRVFSRFQLLQNRVALVFSQNRPEFFQQLVTLFKSSAPESSLGLSFLLARIEVLMGSPNAALQRLKSLSFPRLSLGPSLLHNSLGCLYASLSRRSAALMHFSQSLQSLHQNFSSNSQNSSYIILTVMYNLAIQYLHSSQPLLAFSLFRSALPLFSHKPLIWLRLAECCVLFFSKREESLIKSVFDLGSSRPKIILLPKTSRLLKNSIFSPEYGIYCVRTALYLLDQIQMKFSNEKKEENKKEENEKKENEKKENEKKENEKNEKKENKKEENKKEENKKEENKKEENEKKENKKEENKKEENKKEENKKEENNFEMRESCLLNGAFLGLIAGSASTTLRFCKELEKQTKKSPRGTVLNALYKAEALCLAQKPQQAAEELTEQMNKESEEAHTVLVNLAVINVLMDDLGAAGTYLSQALALKSSSTALLLQVYLEMRRGNFNQALSLIKQK